MTPQEQKRDPSASEIPGGNFSVEVRYNPEFLHHLLTQDNKSHEVKIDHNWEDICEYGYDVFDFLEFYVTSDLKVKSNPNWPDRTSKIVRFAVNIWNNVPTDPKDHWKPKTTNIIENLSSQGLNFELIKIKRLKDYDFFEDYLILKGVIPTLAIDIKARNKSGFSPKYYPKGGIWVHMPGIRIMTPFLDEVDLNSPLDVQNLISPFMGNLEKIIRAFYKLENKHLPLQKLVFAPEITQEKSTEYLRTCKYCDGGFSIVNGLICPHCGGPNPIK